MAQQADALAEAEGLDAVGVELSLDLAADGAADAAADAAAAATGEEAPPAAPAEEPADKGPPAPAPSVTISEIAEDPTALSHFVFVSPDEGTPAAEALAANAAINVTKGDKFMHKLRGMKRPKLKSLNVMKQIRKYTKQSTSLSKNIKGKVIDGVHELYTLTAGMMLGIRVAIGHQSRPATTDADLLRVEDFTFAEKINFPARGNNKPPYFTPPHSLVHTFKFKSYAPKVFKRLREYFSIDSANYMLSVCGNYNYLEFISNSKSGQFFFYSHDGKYMIKTQTKDENKFMKRILPHYYRFVTENPHTQLVRILGMHRVKMYHLRRKVHFVIMASVFDTPQEIHTIYDLKGSLVGRAAKKKERENGGVLKDMDLLTDGKKLHLGPDKKRALLEQVGRDARFLASLNIMDYSLLVGIHYRSRRPEGGVGAGVGLGGAGGAGGGGLGGAGDVSIAPSHSNTPFRRRATSDGSDSEHHAAAAAGSSEGGGADADGAKPGPPLGRTSPKTLRQLRAQSLYVPSPALASALASASTPSAAAAAAAAAAAGAAGAGGAIAGSAQRRRSVGDIALNHRRRASGALSLASLGAGIAKQGSRDEGDGEGDAEGDGEEWEAGWGEEDEGDSDDERSVSVSPGVSGESSPVDFSAKLQANAQALAQAQTQVPAPPPSLDLGVREVEDGRGLEGPEGAKRLAKIIRPASASLPAALLAAALPKFAPSTTSAGSASGAGAGGNSRRAFGPGQAITHPWTGRFDNGINSRVPLPSFSSLPSPSLTGRDSIPEAEADSPTSAADSGAIGPSNNHQSSNSNSSSLSISSTGLARGDEVYYVGIIDILQQYNLHKRGENFFKSFTQNVALISAVDPQTYAKRFIQFLDDNIE